MLYSTDTLKFINRIPHKREFNTWINRLSTSEYNEICQELDSRIDGNDIHTSSWMPGADWTDTPFEPIYEKACLFDEHAAGMCFGLILWKVLMDREDVWGFGRYEKDGIPIQGITYYKLQNPPSE